MPEATYAQVMEVARDYLEATYAMQQAEAKPDIEEPAVPQSVASGKDYELYLRVMARYMAECNARGGLLEKTRRAKKDAASLLCRVVPECLTNVWMRVDWNQSEWALVLASPIYSYTTREPVVRKWADELPAPHTLWDRKGGEDE